MPTLEERFTEADADPRCTSDCAARWGNHYRLEVRNPDNTLTYRVRIGTADEASVTVPSGPLNKFCPAHRTIWEKV